MQELELIGINDGAYIVHVRESMKPRQQSMLGGLEEAWEPMQAW